MELNAFLLLPQNLESILEIIQNEQSFDQFIKDTILVLSNLRKEQGIKLHYDAENIKLFLDNCKGWNNEPYLNNADYKIKSFITLNSIDIRTKPSKENFCMYVLWNYDKCTTVECNPPETIIEMAERIFKYPDSAKEFLLLNMGNAIDACRHFLYVFKDAKHIAELPTNFARIPYITDIGELMLWLKTNHIKNFSLLDKNKFNKIKRDQQGKSVYKEIATGYYWYLDNFHKDEYEVFNSNEEHIGTANLKGEINVTQKVKGRTIVI